ncbi:MAG: TIGR04282 family arsenosugar biosynthesis glycosyltransferase [Planctomycetota bacterium]|nr:TIGR04282 family arsenosugar biosynthesis glycosyltransferase [Planctomycetota bacterium]
MENMLGIFVKRPSPGRVKTRLAAAIGDQTAADLYAAFQADIVDRFRNSGQQRRLGYSPNEPAATAYFQSMAAGDYELWPQPDRPLGERITDFFNQAFHDRAERVVLIGSDSPSLPTKYVDDAFHHLNRVDCVIGPATDGGYYLIGLRVNATLFEGIEWSSRHVLAQTVDRARSLGLSLDVLPPWYDVDTVEDLSVLSGHMRALDYAGEAKLHHTSRMLNDDRIARLG